MIFYLTIKTFFINRTKEIKDDEKKLNSIIVGKSKLHKLDAKSEDEIRLIASEKHRNKPEKWVC